MTSCTGWFDTMGTGAAETFVAPCLCAVGGGLAARGRMLSSCFASRFVWTQGREERVEQLEGDGGYTDDRMYMK